MRVLDSKVEPVGQGRFKVILLIGPDDEVENIEEASPMGEGPTGNAIPDQIVKALIAEAPDHALTADQLKRRLGGNPGTINRQAWTLAANAPDLQLRLRGWVISPERGLYALSEPARAAIKKGRRSK